MQQQMQRIKPILGNPKVAATVTGVLSLVLGGVGGYKIAQSRLKAHYEDLANQEIQQARTFYGRLHKTSEEAKSPEQVLAERHGEDAVEALRTYQGHTPDKPDPVIEEKSELEDIEERKEIIRNVFEDSVPTQADLADRTGDAPYIISAEEFFENENEYDQAAFTFYIQDGVLTDERDTPIQDLEITVGEDNLEKFGYLSKDKNTVYIRNESLELDFEVSRSTGSYAREVLQIDDDDETVLKHSHQRKMRRHDE